jgi:hypothetical protein
MMKLFFGLMDKINRPLHIIDLSPFPRCDEKETSQNRCGGRKTKEQRCVLSEREDDTTKRRSVVDAQKKKKKKKKMMMMMMMKKLHERKDTEGRRVFGSKEDTIFSLFFPLSFF